MARARALLLPCVVGALLAGACANMASSSGGTTAVPVTPPAAPPTADAPRQATSTPPAAQKAAVDSGLPNAKDSLKFAVLGDFGTGDRLQYNLAAQLTKSHAAFPFELVTLVGDNIYGADRPQDYKGKFETPYKPLLDGGVKFYGALGNHDAREQRFYKLFNMDGKLFYDFKAPKQDVRFFALESTYMEPEQVAWLDKTLGSSGEHWKIVFMHHPLYSSGITHGSDERLRATLEPLFVKHGVSLVLTGHDHIYERSKTQQGITHFVTGSGGKLRPGDFRPNQPFSEKVIDDTNVFLLAEIVDDTMHFAAIAPTGRVLDSGTIARARKPTTAAAPQGARP